MDIFTKQDFLNLADIHDQHCISIFIPTHRLGGDETELQDRIRFKNQLKDVKRKLRDYSLTDTEIAAYTKPLDEFLNQENFWRKLSDTLAVFLHGKELKYYTLPIDVEDINYVADHFYLKPLAPLLSRNFRFFIMSLSLGHVRFFDATEHTITEVEMEGLIPREMEESIVLRSEETHSQNPIKRQMADGPAATYHGEAGSDASDKKRQIETYFREIDQGLMKMLHDEKAPLVLAGVDYLIPIYKEVNNYKNLHSKHLSGSLSEKSPSELHELAWELVKDDFTTDLNAKKDRFQELLKIDRAAYKLEEVVPGSIVGRTDTLFLEKNRNIWGNFNASDHSIKIEEQKTIKSACLLNMAAIGTIKNSGEVHLLEPGQMPDDVPAAAIFRYEMK